MQTCAKYERLSNDQVRPRALNSRFYQLFPIWTVTTTFPQFITSLVKLIMILTGIYKVPIVNEFKTLAVILEKIVI